MTKREILSYLLSLFFIVSSFFFSFYALTSISPVDLGDYVVRSSLSSVGISVGVAPNPLSEIAQELSEKERELEEREDYLLRREKELGSSFADRDAMFYFLLAFNLLLLLLIVLNFYFDKRRGKNLPGA